MDIYSMYKGSQVVMLKTVVDCFRVKTKQNKKGTKRMSVHRKVVMHLW